MRACLHAIASLLLFAHQVAALSVPAAILRQSAWTLTQPGPAPSFTMCAVEPTFDDTLKGLLGEAAASGSMETAVDSYLGRLDDTFIPELYARIEAAQSSDPAELERMGAPSSSQLVEAMTVLQSRTKDRYERARDQLQTLLGAGEVNQMDAQLKKLVRNNEIDAGFFYVLLRNMEDARDAGDEDGERLLSHLHTRVQEEMEGRAEPALALLHKVTRLDQLSIRDNVLRDSLAPQTTVPIPGGGELPLDKPVPAKVDPMDLARAIEGALDKVISLPLERSAIEQTAEDIRTVAKQAHQVVADHYDAQMLKAFQDALTPAFARSMPEKYGTPRKVDEYNDGA
mmetsp:Transcript_39830/g.79647  ORF Transcript_39830/g.79647 Transcript_39830/m.79647 type:complete len:341 (-) Transcript_39830:168-1190(-)